jgi:hypothetical protein
MSTAERVATSDGQAEAAPSGMPSTNPMASRKHRLDYWVWFTSIITAMVAALLSLNQAWIASDTEKRSLRAYILVEDASSDRRFTPKMPARWDIRVVNYGKTPSVNTTTVAKVWIGKNALNSADAFFGDPSSNPSAITSFIMPPDHRDDYGYASILSDNALSDEDIARMRSSDAAIVLAGRTWYRDVFGDLHWTASAGTPSPQVPSPPARSTTISTKPAKKLASSFAGGGIIGPCLRVPKRSPSLKCAPQASALC